MYHLFRSDYDGEEYVGSYATPEEALDKLLHNRDLEYRPDIGAVLRVQNEAGQLEDVADFVVEPLERRDDVQGSVFGIGWKTDDKDRKWLARREHLYYDHGRPVPPGHTVRFDGTASRVMTNEKAMEIDRRVREALARGDRTVVYPNGTTGAIIIGTGML